ncbi:hypothetical protein SCLCIDRAFT_1166375 [Scleroderma citrinum Foug A]|uniref:Uncharacterized protein n=1 Tax=Scleroderma citrinum Foug A TaxID=1036808 RepID=A0A0C3E9Q0_9AGAM|nr:hypothetical protein SCLCIDRAFT_1166375 [Scleroderma citrinum Foug A]
MACPTVTVLPAFPQTEMNPLPQQNPPLRRFLPVGAADLAHVQHTINNISFERNDKEVKEEQKRLEALNADEINGEDDLVSAMKNGRADKNNRNKVLNHHPGKQASASHSTNDDTFFKYIKKVFEVPTHPERRHQFDSIDPHYLALDEDASTVSDFK